VTIVEFLPRALPNEDAEVSKEIEKQFKKLGVKILTATLVDSISDDGSVVRVAISKDGKAEELKAEKVLQAIGFAPNVEGYGLDKAGVALTDPQGHRDHRLHAHQRRPHLRDRRRHREAAAGPRRRGARCWWRPKPSPAPRLWRSVITGCCPRDVLPAERRQLRADRGASPGRRLRRGGGQIPVHRQRQSARRGRPQRFRQAGRRRQVRRAAGGHLVGHDVSELLPELTLAQKWDLTANELARNVHTHPTMSEALQECFHGLTGHMINF